MVGTRLTQCYTAVFRSLSQDGVTRHGRPFSPVSFPLAIFNAHRIGARF